jgi:hypothetical protein
MIRMAAVVLLTCTGAHDEFQIQPALDAGGTVVIADAPTCQVNAPLNMHVSGCSLIAGSAKATIRYVGTAPVPAVIRIPDASSQRLANISIYGNALTAFAVETSHVGRSRFENLFLVGAGLHGSLGVANSYSNIRVVGAAGNGFQFDGQYGCYYCDFSDVMAESNSGTGIVLVNSRGNVFHGGTSESNEIGISISDNPIAGYAFGGLNTFIGMSFESNKDADAAILDDQNMFESDNFSGASRVSGMGNRFLNDYVGGGASLTIKAGARKTVLDGVNLVGTLTDNGIGTVKLNMLP